MCVCGGGLVGECGRVVLYTYTVYMCDGCEGQTLVCTNVCPHTQAQTQVQTQTQTRTQTQTQTHRLTPAVIVLQTAVPSALYTSSPTLGRT